MIFSIGIMERAVETTGQFKFHNDENDEAWLFDGGELIDDILVSF